MKKTLLLLLLLLCATLILCACPDNSTDPSLFGNGAEIAGAGDSLPETIPTTETVEGNMTVTESGKVYEGVHFTGTVTVAAGVEDTVFLSCHLTALENRGEGTAVVDSFVTFNGTGISGDGDGLLVQNCRLTGSGKAISVTGAETEIRGCTVRADKDSVGVELRGEGVVNSLVALCELQGMQQSVVLDGVLNTAVVRNSMVSIHANNNQNIYICDNEMGGCVYAEKNDYFLCDGNTYPADGKDHAAVTKNNDHINGDTITDVNAREEVGVNEDLLPQVNRDLFIGMERKATVREFGVEEEGQLYEYILRHSETSDYVIVAPGAYATEMTADFRSQHNNTTVYAYGVLSEGIEYPDRIYNLPHIFVDGVQNLTIKGLSTDYAHQASGQVYVLEKLGGLSVRVITGAGFWNEFSASGSRFFSNLDIGMQRAGTFYSLGDFFVTSVTKNKDGTMTLNLNDVTYETVMPGDVLTCRTIEHNRVVTTQYSKNVTYMDMTQYGYAAGYAFYEYLNDGATTYYRVADITKTGMEIDKATYDRYRALEEQYGVDLEISTDTLADGTLRYRGSPARVGSRDGVHSTGCVEGSRVYSCLFQGLCDDGTNQNSVHARLSEVIDHEDGTLTLIYKGNLSSRRLGADGRAARFDRYCADFRKGDRIYIYTASGQKICDTPVLEDGVYYDTIRSTFSSVDEKDILRYAVKVAKDAVNLSALSAYDLTDDSDQNDQKVLVDNYSRASANAVFDNILFQNIHTNGARIKAPGAVVKNCTFHNIAKTATALIFDIWWGESGIVEGYLFENNLIDHTGYAKYGAPTIEDASTYSYKYTPICIMGLGGQHLSDDYLLFKDIRIEGNKLVNRCLDLYNYAIYIRAAKNVTVKNNDFGTSDEEDGWQKYCGVLYLNGAADVELSGNTYSPWIDGGIEFYVHGDKYKNIFGTDVSVGGVSQIKDKL